MFRFSTFKNNQLTDLKAKVILSLHVNENDTITTKFFVLPLEIDKISSLSMSWTIVHEINEESPIFGMGYGA